MHDTLTDLYAAPQPITISSPGATEEFTGRATGSFFPLGSTVTCFFWSADPTLSAPEPPAEASGNASLLSGRLVWNVQLNLNAIGETSTGFLRARNNGENRIAEVKNLHWAPIKEAFKGELIRIEEPKEAEVVVRYFLVSGIFKTGDEQARIQVELLRQNNTPAMALTLPVLMFERHWATAIISSETGDHYKVRATLWGRENNKLSVHSVGSLKIV